jgi:predicted XRE-type DNA-binding protein
MQNQTLDPIGKDVAFLRKAMIIDLISRGLSQEDVASLLGVNQSSVSEMFPKGILKKAKSLSSRPVNDG